MIIKAKTDTTYRIVFLYSFSDQNGSKTIPFGAAHTYIAYIGEYPLPRASCLLWQRKPREVRVKLTSFLLLTTRENKRDIQRETPSPASPWDM